jgi:hypothetical protein
MGQTVRCMASFGGQTGEGNAQLETDELRFRGAFRLIIPLSQVSAAVARDDLLEVTFPAGTATFALGRQAPVWAAKILHPPTLFDKLGVKPGLRAAVVGLPDKDFRAGLATHGVDVAHADTIEDVQRKRDQPAEGKGGDAATDRCLGCCSVPGDLLAMGRVAIQAPHNNGRRPDLIFYGAAALADLDGIGALASGLPPQGALWVVYPKGRKDIRESDVLGAGRAAGLHDVKVARFSDTHTALKFVIPVQRR